MFECDTILGGRHCKSHEIAFRQIPNAVPKLASNAQALQDALLEARRSPNYCTVGLLLRAGLLGSQCGLLLQGLIGTHLLQAFLVVPLGKTHVPHELGIHPSHGRLVSLLGPLDAVPVVLTILIVIGVVLGLCHGGASSARQLQRRREN